MKLFLLLAIISVFAIGCNCNKNKFEDFLYVSSTSGLLKLWNIEKQLMFEVRGYADALEDKLETLKLHLKTLYHTSYPTVAAREKYVGNPLKAFKLLRRIYEDWIHLQKYTKLKSGKATLEAMKQLLEDKPIWLDMRETLRGISRIEQTYDLKPIDIAEGRLQDKQFNKKLSLRDSLAIATHKYEEGDYTRSAIWYRLAMNIKDEPNSNVYDEVIGKPPSGLRRKFAMSCLMHATKIRYPIYTHKKLLAEVEAFLAKTSSIELENYIRKRLAQGVDQFVEEANMIKQPTSNHERGCRGQFIKKTNLNCRYNFTTHPFLRLAPFRMEEINHDPYIVMFHNVISDNEIEEMKSLAVEMYNGYSGSFTPNQTEKIEIVAHIHWLRDNTPFLLRLNQRISDMTGLDVREFPALQVGNFGLGGYFKPHYDFMYGTRVTMDSLDGLGDRIGSIIFYASDVPQGGQTTFPEIQISVQPQKGSSLFWYNIYDDGTPIKRTLHSVCPVIVGSRWTLTKWFHSDPQMFIKPCSPRKMI
ncbi:prolyl 4-hydroxylase subunit alpha-1-like [Drosophila albomicans]|uniref:procollagen-proline 4-dioxygenase n=1 Tax=Drosophila albomicans TaxID=7291 RepID=A0A6P8XAL8_DROAB|nr:prolyl 4-hydroxylase subunit alpha-1-like [Drosophila albomicans]